jgi:uncharacterized protein YndB with AHSA1/START domain
MKILKILATLIALVVTALALGFLILGLTLPEESQVKTEFDVAAPPEKVWQALNDRGKYPEWAPNIARVEIVNEKEWREWTKDNPDPLTFSVTSEQPPDRMEVKYVMGDFIEGHWKGEIKATAAGSRVSAEDKMRAKTWMAKIMMYPFFDLKEFVNTWNQKLKQRAESLK